MWRITASLLRRRQARLVTRVAIVSLGRAGAMGEVRRVLLAPALHRGGRRRDRAPVASDRLRTPTVWSRSSPAAPCRNVWPGPSHLRCRLEPTTRTWSSSSRPGRSILVVDGPWRLVLDLVDRLSRSYRDRAEVVDGVSRTLTYRARGRAPAGRSPAGGAPSVGLPPGGPTHAHWAPSGCRTSPTPRSALSEPRSRTTTSSSSARCGTRRTSMRWSAWGTSGRPSRRCAPARPRSSQARRRRHESRTCVGYMVGLCSRTSRRCQRSRRERASPLLRSLAPQACRSRCWTRRASDFPRWSRPRRWKATNRVFRCFPQATDGRIRPVRSFASSMMRTQHPCRSQTPRTRVARARYGVESWVPWARSLLKGTAQSPT